MALELPDFRWRFLGDIPLANHAIGAAGHERGAAGRDREGADGGCTWSTERGPWRCLRPDHVPCDDRAVGTSGRQHVAVLAIRDGHYALGIGVELGRLVGPGTLDFPEPHGAVAA